MGPVERAREILRDAASLRRTRVDADPHYPHRCVGASNWNFHEIRTFVLQTQQAVVREIARMVPCLQITGSVDANGKLRGVRYNHYPMVLIPEDLGIPEL